MENVNAIQKCKLETDKLCPQNSDEDKKMYSQGPDNTNCHR